MLQQNVTYTKVFVLVSGENVNHWGLFMFHNESILNHDFPAFSPLSLRKHGKASKNMENLCKYRKKPCFPVFSSISLGKALKNVENHGKPL